MEIFETLQPGSQTVITYSLDGLEKGDWNETDVFYRGSQEVIGATKMDEKLLEEIRRQEQALNTPPPEETEEDDERNQMRMNLSNLRLLLRLEIQNKRPYSGVITDG